MPRGVSAAIAMGLVASLSACSPEIPDPVLNGVNPNWAWNGEVTAIEIRGDDLYPAVQVDPRGQSEARVDAGFQVDLVNGDDVVELEAVALQEGYGRLSAQVPAGGDVGLYDLVVTSPNGGQATIEDAFTITSTRADGLVLDLERSSFEVGELVTIPFHLVDPSDEPVAQSIRVRLSFDAPGVEFEPKDGWTISTGAGGAAEIAGPLNGIGEGSVSMRATEAASYTLSIDPVEDDSVVEGSAQLLTFTPTAMAEVEVVLGDGSKDFSAVAGEPFDVTVTFRDVSGNELEDESIDILITEKCGEFEAEHHVQGSATFPVVVTQATDAERATCPENWLTVYNAPVAGGSAPFAVAPGAADDLPIRASRYDPVAGDRIDLIVEAVDVYDNTITDYTEGLVITDTLEGLRELECELEWSEGLLFCEAALTVAGETAITATDGAISGASGPIVVSPGDAESMVASADAAIAGEQYSVEVQVLDAWGNAASVLDAEKVLNAQGVDTTCAWDHEDAGVHELECETTLAGPQTLTVELGSLGILESIDIDLVNNTLTRIDLTADADPVTAGASLGVTLAGFDDYDNPYTHQAAGSTVTLTGSEGSLSADVSLGGDGAAETVVELTVAGAAVTITATHAGAEVGDLTLEVVPAALDHLEVSLGSALAWLGEPVPLQVTALDEFDNVITDYDGEAALSSTGGLFEDTAASDFDAGIAEAEVTWTSAGLADTVEAETAEGASGTSGAIDALDADCADAPTAVLLIDGGDDAVSCWLSGTGAASASADFSFSARGGAPIQTYYVRVGDGAWSGGGATSASISSAETGRLDVSLAVADAAACGGLDVGTWWVAPYDGSPAAGPISVTLTDDALISGSPTSGQTQVDVSATDCTGDVAAGEIYARVDLGSLLSGTTSGEGLSWTLDASGSASIDWTVVSAVHAGDATVHLGALDGSAHGQATASVSGDSARPTVASADPSGATSELLDELVIAFTEPLSEISAVASTATLTGPDGDVEIDAASLDDAGEVLTLTLSEQLDATDGAFSLSLDGSSAGALRDEGGGNKLDGQWSGGASDFSLQFGAVDDAGIAMDRCSASVARFTPDGDDGPEEQADAVEVTVTADATPTWWWLQAIDADGAVAWSWREAAAGDTDTLSWDGRGDDGFIQPAGVWTLQIGAVDAWDNLSAPCELEIELAQAYSAD